MMGSSASYWVQISKISGGRTAVFFFAFVFFFALFLFSGLYAHVCVRHPLPGLVSEPVGRS